MSTEGTGPQAVGSLRSCTACSAVELAVVIVFAATYNALDFRIYMWGGHAVLDDSRLYLALAYGHWFTYSPFAAIVFVPVAALPLAVARVGWDLVSVAALAYSCTRIVQIAGYRPTRLHGGGLRGGRDGAGPGVGDAVPRPDQPDPAGPDPHRRLARIPRLVPAGRGRGRGDRGRDQADARHLHRVLPAGQADQGGLRRGGHVRRLRADRIPRRAATPPRSTGGTCSSTRRRVGAPYISNQSPYAAAIRIANGQGHIGAWWIVVPLAFAVIGLATATVLARRQDWLGAAAVTGTTGLLVSPISWAHHWVWVLPALVLLIRAGHRIAAGAGYLLFAVAPFWFTPHAAGPREYGFHWLMTLVANCFLIAGLAFLGYMALAQLRRPRRGERRA